VREAVILIDLHDEIDSDSAQNARLIRAMTFIVLNYVSGD
jgi:hypothetical protein